MGQPQPWQGSSGGKTSGALAGFEEILGFWAVVAALLVSGLDATAADFDDLAIFLGDGVKCRCRTVSKIKGS